MVASFNVKPLNDVKKPAPPIFPTPKKIARCDHKADLATVS